MHDLLKIASRLKGPNGVTKRKGLKDMANLVVILKFWYYIEYFQEYAWVHYFLE